VSHTLSSKCCIVEVFFSVQIRMVFINQELKPRPSRIKVKVGDWKQCKMFVCVPCWSVLTLYSFAVFSWHMLFHVTSLALHWCYCIMATCYWLPCRLCLQRCSFPHACLINTSCALLPFFWAGISLFTYDTIGLWSIIEKWNMNEMHKCLIFVIVPFITRFEVLTAMCIMI
jgi:hypothetical protein